MLTRTYARRLAAIVAALLTAFARAPQARTAHAADFSGIWGHFVWPDFAPPPDGAGPVKNLSRLNGISNTRQLVGDYTNPILTPGAAAIVRQQGDLERKGIPHATPANQCWPGGVPFVLFNLGMQMIQQKDRIVIVYALNNEIREVRLNGRHPDHVTPSWFGDSVGHYEDDSLVIDTVGIKVGPYAMVDMYGTPHTERLHVVERYRLVPYEAANDAERGDRDNFRVPVTDLGLARNPADRSPGLVLDFMVDDPGAFTSQWSARVVYRRPLGSWPEDICADSPRDQIGRALNLPAARTPDF